MYFKKNPFESLRVPGLISDVSSGSYNSVTIYNQGNAAALQIRTEELKPGIWAFGFYIILGDKTREMIPGEGSGWFSSEQDARLYALGHIRYGSLELPEDLRFAIDAAISKIRNVPLFELD